MTPVMRIPEYDREGCQKIFNIQKMSETYPMIRLIRSEINQQREIRISKRTRGVKW